MIGMSYRSVVRTITIVEIIHDSQFKGIKHEDVRTAELANLVAEKVIDRSSAFRVKHNTIVIREHDPLTEIAQEIPDPMKPLLIEKEVSNG